MMPVQISPAPQPSGNAKATSQTDNAGNNQAADGQAPEPFSKVLSRKVDKTDTPSKKTEAADSSQSNGVSQTDTQATTQAVVSPDALAAIMSQIPVEMRGTSVTDRATIISADSRLPAAIDTVLPKSDAPQIQIDARTLIKADAPSQTGVPEADSRKKPSAESQNDVKSSFAAKLQTETKSIAVEVDATRQNTLIRADSTRNLPQPLASQLAASQASATTTLSQSTVASMTGTTMGTPAINSTQTVSTPLGSAAWGDDFSQKVNWMITQKNQVAELHLNPPNLGPLDVVIKITDNQATALFTSPHAMVREAVESALPKLRELMADNGIMLSNATVGDQSRRDREADEPSTRNTGSGARRDSEASMESPASAPLIRRHNGVLDTFA